MAPDPGDPARRDTLDLATVEEAAAAIRPFVRRTPLLPSEWLSRAVGARVHLKCENLQVTGSFKVRGALAAVTALSSAQRRAGVITASAGNHGLGLARACRELGVPCRVAVPRKTPRVKREGIEREGAVIEISPHDGYDATQAWVLNGLGSGGPHFVSPFEDDRVAAGNGGTIMLEILEDLPAVDAVWAPVGGGGLANGLGTVLRERSPGTRLIGVNTEASPGMWMSFRDGHAHLEVAGEPTVAEGLEGGVGERSYALARTRIDEMQVVPEIAIRRAIAGILRRERMVVEGSGAAAVAGIREAKAPVEGTVCVVLTGSNIDEETLLGLLRENPDRRGPTEHATGSD